MCFQIRVVPLSNSEKLFSNVNTHFVKKSLEVGEIIPFLVWINAFPVSKIDFEPFGSNEKHFVKVVFD